MAESAFIRCPFCEAILPPGSVIGEGKPTAAEQLHDVLDDIRLDPGDGAPIASQVSLDHARTVIDRHAKRPDYYPDEWTTEGVRE
jgi:hypothetical protein